MSAPAPSSHPSGPAATEDCRPLAATGPANVARVYDWLLGGKDHYAADREAGRRLVAAVPGGRQAARDNRAFLGRVTRYLAGQGITQFIDIGSGLPAAGAVHQVAREANPNARVAYVDHDPVVAAHARALLADSPAAAPPQVVAVEADLRYPRHLLTMREIRDLIDLSQPVGILLVAVLHFLADGDRPHDIVQAIAARLARAVTSPSPTSQPITSAQKPPRPQPPPMTARPRPASLAPATTSKGSSTAWRSSRPA